MGGIAADVGGFTTPSGGITRLSQLWIDADKAWPAPWVGTHTPAWPAVPWLFRKRFTVTNTTAGLLTDYQIKLRIYSDFGVDSGNNLYTNGLIRNTFADFRVTNNAGALLSYWIESISLPWAHIWVKLDSVPVGTTDFWIYFGHATAPSLSNGPATFEAFDDFNDGVLNGWTERDPIACTWSAIPGAAYEGADGCQGQMGAAGDGGILTWDAATFEDCRIEAWVRLPDADTLANCQGGFVAAWVDNNNYYIIKLHDAGATERVYIREVTAGVGADRANANFTIAPGSWYKLTVFMRKDGADLIITVYIDDVYYTTYTDVSPRVTPNSVGIWCANTNLSRVWCDVFHVCKYVNPEPAVSGAGSLEGYYESYGVENIAELAAGMAKGDMLISDGTRLIITSPAAIGTELTAKDPGNLPDWEFPT